MCQYRSQFIQTCQQCQLPTHCTGIRDQPTYLPTNKINSPLPNQFPFYYYYQSGYLTLQLWHTIKLSTILCQHCAYREDVTSDWHAIFESACQSSDTLIPVQQVRTAVYLLHYYNTEPPDCFSHVEDHSTMPYWEAVRHSVKESRQHVLTRWIDRWGCNSKAAAQTANQLKATVHTSQGLRISQMWNNSTLLDLRRSKDVCQLANVSSAVVNMGLSTNIKAATELDTSQH